MNDPISLFGSRHISKSVMKFIFSDLIEHKSCFVKVKLSLTDLKIIFQRTRQIFIGLKIHTSDRRNITWRDYHTFLEMANFLFDLLAGACRNSFLPFIKIEKVKDLYPTLRHRSPFEYNLYLFFILYRFWVGCKPSQDKILGTEIFCPTEPVFAPDSFIMALIVALNYYWAFTIMALIIMNYSEKELFSIFNTDILGVLFQIPPPSVYKRWRVFQVYQNMMKGHYRQLESFLLLTSHFISPPLLLKILLFLLVGLFYLCFPYAKYFCYVVFVLKVCEMTFNQLSSPIVVLDVDMISF